MRDVIGEAGNGALIPGVVEIEPERRVHADRRMQARSRLPRAETHTGDELAFGAGAREREAAAVARDEITLAVQMPRGELHPLERRVDEARSAAGAGLFAEHRPRLERMAQLELGPLEVDRAVAREAELEVRAEPLALERVARRAQIVEHFAEVLPDEVRQHVAIVQLGAEVHELARVRLLPEPREHRAQDELLRKAHARVRRHLEAAELDEPEPAGRRIRREQLVD